MYATEPVTTQISDHQLICHLLINTAAPYHHVGLHALRIFYFITWYCCYKTDLGMGIWENLLGSINKVGMHSSQHNPQTKDWPNSCFYLILTTKKCNNNFIQPKCDIFKNVVEVLCHKCFSIHSLNGRLKPGKNNNIIIIHFCSFLGYLACCWLILELLCCLLAYWNVECQLIVTESQSTFLSHRLLRSLWMSYRQTKEIPYAL